MLTLNVFIQLLAVYGVSSVLSNPLRIFPTKNNLDNGLDLGNGPDLGNGLDLNNGLDVDLDANIVLGTPDLLNLDVDLGLGRLLDLDAAVSIDKRQSRSSDQTESLRLHNVARKGKKVPELVWDSMLAADAKAYAEQLAKLGKMVHSKSQDRPGQGENLAYAWSTGTISSPITQGTKAWLDEEKYYKNETIPNGSFSQYGHYTQALWKNSLKYGVAAAKNGSAWYTVARYSPAGNIVGQKPY